VQGFKQLLQSHANCVLLIVGVALTDEYLDQLKDVVEQLGIGDKVRFTDRVTREQFDKYLLTCDVVINLRHPSRRQMSATLIRAMAAGKPLIISDLPEWQAFPDEFCWRVKHGDPQQDVSTLAEYLRTLAADPAQRTRMGSAARVYFEQSHTVTQMVAAYLDVVQAVTGRVIQGAVVESEDMHVTKAIHFNKVCELEDFSDPELIETIRDVFPHEMAHFSPEFPKGTEYRKYWEIAMSVRALRTMGALHPDASILGVGAGTEATTFYLTNHVRQVVATDLYLSPGTWGNFAPGFMLVEPEKVAPYPFHRERLVVQHMDGRLLHFPDNSFDGIYSSGSIEHFGGPADIAASAYEMGRVLKPGGILTLSTEFQISGPPGGEGWPGVYLFTSNTIRRLIMEASGLELVDELDSEVSPLTLETRQDLSQIVADMNRVVEAQGAYPRVGEVIWPRYPHILQVSQGYVFGSVHLTLRKTEKYPLAPTAWAKPNQAIVDSIEQMNREARQAIRREPEPFPSATGSSAMSTSRRGAMERALKSWDTVRQRTLQSRMGKRLPSPLAFAYRTALRVRGLGMAWDGQYSLYKAMIQTMNALEARLRNLEISQTSAVTRADLEHLKAELGAMAPGRRATSRAAHLTGDSMTALFRTLEAALSALAAAQAVEVSVQDSAAETAIVAAAAYFGSRMSSSGSTYRGPNDLWYHVDFSAQWDRAALLENAANKLVPGGHFVLVTASENTDAPQHPRLTLITDQVVPLPGEMLARAFVYRL
jgi:SAM-dependent methyltransferase